MRRSPSRRTAPEIRTERLLMRGWRDDDLEPFAAFNADPEVMEFMPRLLSRSDCATILGRLRDHFDRHGFGWWAVEVPGTAPLIGCVGVAVPRFEAHFTPCVEVGWRLARAHWGQGYATEAAQAAIAFGFEQAGLDEIVSLTAVVNERSQSVMRRLGMTRNPAEDFDHPDLPAHHWLCRHVLFRIDRGRWAELPDGDGRGG